VLLWIGLGFVNDAVEDPDQQYQYSDFPLLLAVLSSDCCDIAESFDSTITYDDMATHEP
jgi:hypothetical protein